MRRGAYAVVVALVVLVAILAGRRWQGANAKSSAASTKTSAARTWSATHSRILTLRQQIGGEATSPIADELNAANGSADRDVRIVNAVFEAWQTNFPGRGNPVGENDEITLALAGDNPMRFAFVSPRNPAINSAGQLCDRWGTPYRLHQLSGQVMEIWSAGPDRRFGTGDDVRYAPPASADIPR